MQKDSKKDSNMTPKQQKLLDDMILEYAEVMVKNKKGSKRPKKQKI